MDRRITWMAAAFGLACIATAGCKSTEPGDEAAKDEDFTSASQLEGSDLPPGAYSLTFDDGPGARTEEIANWLGDRNIVATFFINGKNAPGHESALAAIVRRGHILANHTQNHADMRELLGDDLYFAVKQTDDVIAERQPNGPWLIRAPYGAWNARVSEDINGSDMKKYVGPIFWNIGGALTESTGADWACWSNDLTVGDCAGRYMSEMRARRRGVILMHDSHSATIDLAKVVVQQMAGDAKWVSLADVPSIAAALGREPGSGLGSVTANRPGEEPTPVTPGAPLDGPACGSVTYQGFCDRNVLTWCNDGALKTVDCVDKDKVCSLKNATEGHDCVAKAPCGDVDYNGSCKGTVLTWCDEASALRHSDCAAKGKRCAPDGDTGNNCVD